MNDKYTEDKIREAIQSLTPAGMDSYNVTPDEVIAVLQKPEIQFSEGQVLRAVGPNHFGLFIFSDEKYPSASAFIEQSRPLNQTEVGSDWVPAEKVRVLREAVKQAIAGEYPPNERGHGLESCEYHLALALKDFDEVIHDQ